MRVELPTWRETDLLNTQDEILNPVEQFIYDHEPFPAKIADEWREALACALENACDCEV